jgi:flagellum-specific peptidoglycan hydrolase FlgJ
MTPEQSVALRRIAEAAVAAERETGCPAEISAAQCILESAWLQVAPGNNCFGIKARASGDCQYRLTKEYVNGEWKSQKLAFATYPTLAACFSAHARLLQSGPYAPAWRRYQADHDLDAYIRGIAEHYATDPGYEQKVPQLAHGPHLTAMVAEARQKAVDGVGI